MLKTIEAERHEAKPHILITESTGHDKQWMHAICSVCHEACFRQHWGDMDDWWAAEWIEWVDNHECSNAS